LIVIFPVLFLYAQNAAYASFQQVVLPLVLVILCTALLLVVMGLLYRDIRRAALATTGIALLALSYGHVFEALSKSSYFPIRLVDDRLLLPVSVIAISGLCVFIRRLRAMDEVTTIVNAVAVAMVILSIINARSASVAHVGQALATTQRKPPPPTWTLPPSRGEGSKRDIYYLIFDRYPRADVLRKHFGYNNSSFIGDLRRKGFYVADRSVCNYPRTIHSLAASLNMEYLTYEPTNPKISSGAWRPYDLLIGPKVSRFLQSHGYRHVHTGASYPTPRDATAEFNFEYSERSEFARVFVHTTVLRSIAGWVGFAKDLDVRQSAHNEILYQLDKIRMASKIPGPTYTIGHVLLPHEPYTFDAKGRFVTEAKENSRSFEENVVMQTQFANRKIKELIDELLRVPDYKKPIIILQSDEGPPQFNRDPGDLRWAQETDEELRYKFGILNAYYLPGVKDPGLYPTITPVNSFRKVFNLYFGTDLDLLPDESYVFGSSAKPYSFQRVTERLRP
jgi:type II secretory pathway pseudopilin PulG